MGKLASFQHIFEENAPEHFCKEDDNIMAHDENHLHFDVYTWRCLCIELRLMCVWSGLLVLFFCCRCVNVCVLQIFLVLHFSWTVKQFWHLVNVHWFSVFGTIHARTSSSCYRDAAKNFQIQKFTRTHPQVIARKR